MLAEPAELGARGVHACCRQRLFEVVMQPQRSFLPDERSGTSCRQPHCDLDDRQVRIASVVRPANRDLGEKVREFAYDQMNLSSLEYPAETQGQNTDEDSEPEKIYVADKLDEIADNFASKASAGAITVVEAFHNHRQPDPDRRHAGGLHAHLLNS